MPGSARIALYPILIAAALVVELFVASGVSPLVVVRSLVVALAAGALLSGAGRMLLGDRDRGGVLATLAIFLFLTGADPRIALVLGLSIALLFVERFAVPPARRLRWPVIGRFFARATAVLLLAIGIQAFQLGTPEVIARALTNEAPFRAPSPPVAGADRLPDVYVLLLDGHARADVLARVIGHDPSALVEGLERRGFMVAGQSRTNYALTVQVVASMLHMRPLQEIDSVQGLLAGTEGRPPGAIIRETIDDGPALERLRDEGYELIALASSYEEPALRAVDRWIDTGELNEFEVNLFRRTVLRPLLPVIAPDWVSSNYRSRAEHEFEALVALAAERTERPRFIFGHLPTPHAPWVRHADGSPRTVLDVDAIFSETPASTGLDHDALVSGYSGQVAWVDGRLLEVVDQILVRSVRPPVIVVFGDHGTWIGADGGDMRLRFLPLFAARMPDGSRPFPDDVELIDVFGWLFASLFGDPPPAPGDHPSYIFARRDNEYSLVAVPDPNAALPKPTGAAGRPPSGADVREVR